MYRETSCGRQESTLNEFRAETSKHRQRRQDSERAPAPRRGCLCSELGVDEIYVTCRSVCRGPLAASGAGQGMALPAVKALPEPECLQDRHPGLRVGVPSSKTRKSDEGKKGATAPGPRPGIVQIVAGAFALEAKTLKAIREPLTCSDFWRLALFFREGRRTGSPSSQPFLLGHRASAAGLPPPPGHCSALSRTSAGSRSSPDPACLATGRGSAGLVFPFLTPSISSSFLCARKVLVDMNATIQKNISERLLQSS